MERQFTRQAENALKLATTIAKSCGHGYIGTEHLLAGLLKEPEGTAGKVLQEFNVEEEKTQGTYQQPGYTGSGQYCGSRNKRSPVQPESKKDH